VTTEESESDVDPLTIGTAAVAKSVGDESGRLLSRVLGPSADVIGDWLRGKTEYRLNNTERIVRKAAEKAGLDRAGEVPPRVAHQILNDGSFCDDELMAEYLGGVLAASKTPGGRDDRGVAWSDFVNGMSALEVRAHFLLYRAWDELLSSREDLDLWTDSDRAKARLFVDEIEFQRTLTDESDVASSDALAHALNGLMRRGLVLYPGWGARAWVAARGHNFDFVVTALPTLAGLELYGWALGLAGLTPANFRQVSRQWTDPTLPRLTSIQLTTAPDGDG
jgi:hypothetical protein